MSFNIKFYSFQKQNFDETRRRKTFSAKISTEERYFKLYSLANSVGKVWRQNLADISSKNERRKGHTASPKNRFRRRRRLDNDMQREGHRTVTLNKCSALQRERKQAANANCKSLLHSLKTGTKTSPKSRSTERGEEGAEEERVKREESKQKKLFLAQTLHPTLT